MNPAKVTRDRLTRLTDLPNVGPAFAGDLELLGINRPDIRMNQLHLTGRVQPGQVDLCHVVISALSVQSARPTIDR
jgi:hypothetical protein